MPRDDRKISGEDSISEYARSRVPEVILDVTFKDGLFFITLKNIGQGPAYKVRTEFDREIYGCEGTIKINSLALFKQIEFLPPSKEITIFLDMAYSYFKGKQPNLISATITYLDTQKHKHASQVKHNLEIYKRFPYMSNKSE